MTRFSDQQRQYRELLIGGLTKSGTIQLSAWATIGDFNQN